MSVLGNPLMLGGGGGGAAYGYAWHTAGSTSYTVVCGSGSAKTAYGADGNCFSFSGGVFTCLKAGTYKVKYFGRGSYNTSGTAIYLYYHIYQNSTAVVTANSTSTGAANSGVCTEITLTVAVGDTISADTRNSSGATAHNFGYIITPA